MASFCIALVFSICHWHLVVVLCHLKADVVLVMGDLFDYLDEGWDRELFLLFGGLDPKERRLPIDVQEGLHHEVLALVDEALPCLLKDLAVRAPGLLEELDVFPGRHLTSLFNPLAALVGSHLVRVSEHIVLSRLPEEVLSHVSLRH